MTWFKVDDKLHGHRKARKVRSSHPEKHRDVAPFGLWVLAGSWAGDNGTAGFVPTEVLSEWDDYATLLATRLVEAGLWWETVQDGEPGFGFHDWADYTPKPEGIEDSSESGRRGNHVRWHEKRDQVDPDCEFCAHHRPDIAPISPPDDRPESGTASGANREPVPSRPDLNPSKPSSGEPDEKTGADLVLIVSRPDAQRVCDHLADRIAEDGSKRPAVTAKWLDAARLLMDRDGRTEDQVHAAIDWCQNDPFWRGNILSMPKLREKYDQLRKKAAEAKSQPDPNADPDGENAWMRRTRTPR